MTPMTPTRIQTTKYLYFKEVRMQLFWPTRTLEGYDEVGHDFFELKHGVISNAKTKDSTLNSYNKWNIAA
jgi:hypothetical protein